MLNSWHLERRLWAVLAGGGGPKYDHAANDLTAAASPTQSFNDSQPTSASAIRRRFHPSHLPHLMYLQAARPFGPRTKACQAKS